MIVTDILLSQEKVNKLEETNKKLLDETFLKQI